MVPLIHVIEHTELNLENLSCSHGLYVSDETYFLMSNDLLVTFICPIPFLSAMAVGALLISFVGH